MLPTAQDAAPPLQINADCEQRAVMLPSDACWQASPLPGVARWMLDRVGGEVARATSLVRYAPSSRFNCQLRQWRQFAVDDLQPVRMATRAEPWQQRLGPGLSVMPIHEHPGGEVILVLDGGFRDEFGACAEGSSLRSPRWSRHTPFTGPERRAHSNQGRTARWQAERRPTEKTGVCRDGAVGVASRIAARLTAGRPSATSPAAAQRILFGCRPAQGCRGRAALCRSPQ